MAEQGDLASRLEALEARLRIPEKSRVSAQANEAGKALASALRLPDRIEAKALSERVAALGERSNLVVEWRARDVESSTAAAAVACACCCCCCCFIVS